MHRCVESSCGQVFWWGPRSQLGAELLENKVDKVRTPSSNTDANEKEKSDRKTYNPLLRVPREDAPPADPSVPRPIKKGEFKRLYTLSPQKDEINTQNFITKDAARTCDAEPCSVDIFLKEGDAPDTFRAIVKQV